jgi:asparagine synthase (glutamine-hydrolysing)
MLTCSAFQYNEDDTNLVQRLDGMFSFVLLDKKRNRVIAARDPIGITTLYYGWNSKMPETVYFASELKSLNEDCDKILAFPPGHIYDSDTKETTRWFNPTWWNGDRIPTSPVDYKVLRESLETAVRKRLMAEVPYGVLLSGGLDSSLIAAIAARETDKIANSATADQSKYRKRKKKKKGNFRFDWLHE